MSPDSLLQIFTSICCLVFCLHLNPATSCAPCECQQDSFGEGSSSYKVAFPRGSLSCCVPSSTHPILSPFPKCTWVTSNEEGNQEQAPWISQVTSSLRQSWSTQDSLLVDVLAVHIWQNRHLCSEYSTHSERVRCAQWLAWEWLGCAAPWYWKQPATKRLP